MKFRNFLNSRKPAWLVTAIGFLTALAAFFFLPGEIPTHWNSFGVADGYGSRLFIFLMPVLMLLVMVLTGRKNIRYALTHSKAFLTDMQFNWYTSGVCILFYIMELTISARTFSEV